jgi:hypothetical protein
MHSCSGNAELYAPRGRTMRRAPEAAGRPPKRAGKVPQLPHAWCSCQWMLLSCDHARVPQTCRCGRRVNTCACAPSALGARSRAMPCLLPEPGALPAAVQPPCAGRHGGSAPLAYPGGGSRKTHGHFGQAGPAGRSRDRAEVVDSSLHPPGTPTGAPARAGLRRIFRRGR